MSSHPEVPALVTKALRASLDQGFIEATRSETGRLLATLAATRTGTIAECGTGCGVGAAWLRSGAPATTRVVTAELDPTLAAGARDTFASSDVEVLAADWTELADEGPFSLLFLDADIARTTQVDDVLDLVEPGGIVIIDDLTPCATWPPAHHNGIDVMRLEWLSDARVASMETLVAEDTAVLVAVRRVA
ncbi:class I SAM-dependent methyltransferase [Mariniluteicoccus endophyticus]